MNKAAIGVTFILSMLALVATNAQNSLFQEWQSKEELSITVLTDWDSLYAVRDESYVDAVLMDGRDNWEISVRLRGVSRRRDCDFKPFQINLKKKALKNKGLSEYDKIKVVTECIDDKDGEENVFEELLVYELYNLLTDESFRAIQCNFTYKWPGDREKPLETKVLILEPNAECFDRLGGVEVEKYNMPADSIEPLSYLRMAVFQFMIGNTDWSHGATRNVKMLRQEAGLLTMIPYDFDYSAVVSPSYARINPDYAVKDFRDRIYLGQYFDDLLPQVLDEYVQARQIILDHVDNFPDLKSARKKWIRNYIEDFYEFIESPDTVLAYKVILPYEE